MSLRPERREGPPGGVGGKGEPENEECPVDIPPGERACHGGQAPALQAEQDRAAPQAADEPPGVRRDPSSCGRRKLSERPARDGGAGLFGEAGQHSRKGFTASPGRAFPPLGAPRKAPEPDRLSKSDRLPASLKTRGSRKSHFRLPALKKARTAFFNVLLNPVVSPPSPGRAPDGARLPTDRGKCQRSRGLDVTRRSPPSEAVLPPLPGLWC